MNMRPLHGIRIVDFGIITAGASASAILADLGAEVIKIEGPSYLDPFRIWVGRGEGRDWWNDSPQFSFTNRNKRGICIDLKSEQGRNLVLRLVRKSDVVLENFRVGVLDRLGLGFQALVKVNPSIILVSISSQGATGPEAQAVSFGSTLEASSGLSSLITAEDGQPLISGHALNYPDQIVSLSAAGMVLSALIHAQNNPEPVHLDISQRELTAYMLGEWFGNGADAADVVGQRGTEGIVASADGKWIAYRLLEGVETLTSTEIEAFIAENTAEIAIASVRAQGHAAEIVHQAEAVYARHFDDPAIHAFTRDPNNHPVKGLPWTLGLGSLPVERPAPTLGSDNEYVVRDVLGLGADEYASLVAQKILTTAPSP